MTSRAEICRVWIRAASSRAPMKQSSGDADDGIWFAASSRSHLTSSRISATTRSSYMQRLPVSCPGLCRGSGSGRSRLRADCAADRDLRRLPVRDVLGGRGKRVAPQRLVLRCGGQPDPDARASSSRSAATTRPSRSPSRSGGGTFTATADLDMHEFLGGLRLNARGQPAARSIRTGARRRDQWVGRIDRHVNDSGRAGILRRGFVHEFRARVRGWRQLRRRGEHRHPFRSGLSADLRGRRGRGLERLPLPRRCGRWR